jgi:hypothetical protein
MEQKTTTTGPLTGVMLGNYRLGERIGAGGSAAVYLAASGEKVVRGPALALKVIHAHLAESPDFVNMFLDEARLAVRLAHPGIVRSYELGRTDTQLFLAMDYLPGQPLSALLERTKERAETLPPSLVAWIGACAAEALAYAHALTDESGQGVGVVHRDVSPENVFLTYDGRVLLIDFGIARAAGRITETRRGRIKGKFRYMAPEQMLGEEVDHRADQFALGATLYEAAVGERPFDAETEAESIARMLDERPWPPEDRIPGFPPELARVMLRALECEPSKRYANSAEMASDLSRFAADAGGTGFAQVLSELLGRLFAAEREREARSVARLLGLRRSVAKGPPGSTTTADPTATTIRPSLKPPRRRVSTVAVASVAVVASLASYIFARAQVYTGFVPAEPALVQVEVELDPPVEATIQVDGRPATGKPAHVTLARGTVPVQISVVAPGYAPRTVRAVPDRDRFVQVALAPETPPRGSASLAP